MAAQQQTDTGRALNSFKNSIENKNAEMVCEMFQTLPETASGGSGGGGGGLFSVLTGGGGNGGSRHRRLQVWSKTQF